ncbi:SMI1/KNR4 family protein [Lentzea albidocapillata]|uniref:SMI1 / KNR4 family (SUKH-1) n=1 Tax=Lentzea albidocapillata TaxID=40571 RepID=A0A1W2FQ86_9PSEU|nr:SMI1/KNR4 family protein [Lentzea albidocapillata]SMD23778.1 SMI1 / KNR4 family (SUKH-1) [Lentzea albidocapillata]
MKFWTEDSYGVQAPLTDEAVREAEALLGVRLPEALLELLRVQNGGGVVDERSAFPTSEPTSWAPDHVPFDSLMGIGTAERTTSLLDTRYLVEEWGLPSPVVLLTGDGHWWIALDYRTCGVTGEPSVVWLDAEGECELPLAADFRTFLDGLVPAESFD